MSDVPRVTLSPTEGGGVPLINGIQTDIVAEAYLAGHDHVLGAYSLTRHEVIVACWYEARWGGREMFMENWELWARYVDIELKRGELAVDDLPLPPKFTSSPRRNEPGE